MTAAVLACVVAVGLVLWYMVACLIWPWANCWRCDGGGRFRSPSGRAWRDCRRCGGTGRRERVGRKLWHWYRR